MSAFAPKADTGVLLHIAMLAPIHLASVETTLIKLFMRQLSGGSIVKRIFICCITIWLVSASPAMADEPLAVTPSGSTEAYFNLSLVETSDELANSCVDFGWKTISSTETVVVCEVPVSAGNRFLSALAAPRYATPPREFIRFNIAGSNGLSRVQASGWREIQTAFGQTQRTELGNENYHNAVMGFMIHIGAHYPPGTEFPNHAAMDVDYEFVGQPEKGMLITKIYPDGAFANAGMLVGDIVTRIARERIKNNNDVSDGLHKAIRRETFEVQFLRDAIEMKALVPRVFRTAAGPLPEPKVEKSQNEPPAMMVLQKEFSVAEELERLADLRDRGILTDEEFEEQKRKVLDK